MRTFNHTEKLAFQQHHPRLPIKYWEALVNNRVIDFNNSIALLRNKYKGIPGVIFKSVR